MASREFKSKSYCKVHWATQRNDAYLHSSVQNDVDYSGTSCFFQQEDIIKALLTSPFSQYVAMASQIHRGIGLATERVCFVLKCLNTAVYWWSCRNVILAFSLSAQV